jgi:hypothetical protein
MIKHIDNISPWFMPQLFGDIFPKNTIPDQNIQMRSPNRPQIQSK